MTAFAVARLIRRAIALAVIVGIVLMSAATIMVTMQGLSLDRQPADAIVVMGAAQFDGEPSPVLKNRLDHALALFRKGIAPRIITVGGKQPGDRFTEAEAGVRYLRKQGVARSKLVALSSGTDTFSSATAVATWSLTKTSRSLMVVSDRAHLARAASMIRSFGVNVQVSGPAKGPGSSLSPTRVLYEAAGLVRFWLIGNRTVSEVVGGPFKRFQDLPRT